MLTTRINCRFNHTYMDEDMLGTCKGLAKKVHRKLLEVRLLGRFLLRLKTYRSRTVIPVRRMIKKCVENLEIHCWLQDTKVTKIMFHECRYLKHTEPYVGQMWTWELTFVNVGLICIRPSLGDIIQSCISRGVSPQHSECVPIKKHQRSFFAGDILLGGSLSEILATMTHSNAPTCRAPMPSDWLSHIFTESSFIYCQLLGGLNYLFTWISTSGAAMPKMTGLVAMVVKSICPALICPTQLKTFLSLLHHFRGELPANSLNVLLEVSYASLQSGTMGSEQCLLCNQVVTIMSLSQGIFPASAGFDLLKVAVWLLSKQKADNCDPSWSDNCTPTGQSPNRPLCSTNGSRTRWHLLQ